MITLKKAISQRHSAEIITDADYADDQAYLANISVLAEFLQQGHTAPFSLDRVTD